MAKEPIAVTMWREWGRAIAASRGLTALDLSTLVPAVRAKKAITRVLVSLSRPMPGELLSAELQVRFEKKTPVELDLFGTCYELAGTVSKELVLPEGVGARQGGRVALASTILKLVVWGLDSNRIIPSVLETSSFMGRADRYLRCGRIEQLSFGHDVALGSLKEIDGHFTASGDTYDVFTKLGLTCTDEADDAPATLSRTDWRDRMDPDFARMVHEPKVVWRDDEGGRVEFGVNVKWGYRGPKLRTVW